MKSLTCFFLTGMVCFAIIMGFDLTTMPNGYTSRFLIWFLLFLVLALASIIVEIVLNKRKEKKNKDKDIDK